MRSSTPRPSAFRVTLTPSSPDFRGKLPPFFLERLVNDPACLLVSAAAVLGYGLDIFGQGASARVVLPGSAANSDPRHGRSNPCVTKLAQPAEVRGRVVLFVAVAMVHDQEPSRSTQLTEVSQCHGDLPTAIWSP